MDVDAEPDVGALGDLQRVRHLEAVPGRRAQRGHQQVRVGEAVGRTPFEGLLVAEVLVHGFLERIALGRHIDRLKPAEWDADEGAAVGERPAERSRGFLVRHQPHERQWMRVAEGRERRAGVHVAGDRLPALVGQTAAARHHRAAVTGETAMHVHAGARLAGRDLRSEGQDDLVFVRQLAHYPFGHDQLVGGLFDIHGEEFDLVLLVDAAALGEVAHLGVAVLDLASGLGYQAHGFGPEIGELVERSALVIAFLVLDLIYALGVGDHIVFKLAHGLHLHSRDFLEGIVRLMEDELGRTFERFSLAVEVRA